MNKLAISAISFCSGFFAAFIFYQYHLEKSILEEDTWKMYNPVKNNMVLLSNESRSCTNNPVFYILHRQTEEGVKEVHAWHMKRIKEFFILDTSKYIEDHERERRHQVKYLARVKDAFSSCS